MYNWKWLKLQSSKSHPWFGNYANFFGEIKIQCDFRVLSLIFVKRLIQILQLLFSLFCCLCRHFHYYFLRFDLKKLLRIYYKHAWRTKDSSSQNNLWTPRLCGVSPDLLAKNSHIIYILPRRFQGASSYRNMGR